MQWTTTLGIRIPPSVRLSHRVGANRMRGVFLDSRVARGQLIAVVPERAIIAPEAASGYLSAAFPMLYRESLRRVCNAVTDNFGSNFVWFSRDQVMVACSLAAWRLSKTYLVPQQQHRSWRPFDDYLALLPKNRPPPVFSDSASSSSALQVFEGGEKPLIDRFATPLDVRNNMKTSRLGIPSSSVNADEAIFSGEHLASSEDIGRLEHTVRSMSLAFWESVRSIDNHHNLVKALTEGIVARGGTSSSNDTAAAAVEVAVRGAFEWAHFMLRSRAVCPVADLGEDASSLSRPKPLLVPFVDMLNHSMRDANTTVAWNRGASILPETTSNAGGGDDASPDEALHAEVLVSALRDMEPGEELRLNYAHYKMRGRLLFERTPIDRIDTAALQQLVRAQRAAGVNEDRHAWQWAFGFDIPPAEMEYTKEAMWSSSLRGRLQRMMNTRRKGRPGEFVVGVPEGLKELRRQRAAVEEKFYGKQQIFPVQAK